MTYLNDLARLVREHLPLGARPPVDSDGLFLLYAVLVRVKGVATTEEDVHDAWAAWMLTVDPAHPCLLPFGDLPPEVQDEDVPYMAAIRDVARLTRHGE